MIKDRVCQHLRATGYGPAESARYASLVQKWCDQSGKEWTVERLKALKDSFQKSLETGEYSLPAYWATRTNRSGKTIVRDGFVHRVLSSPNEGANLRRKEAFLRIYQVIKLDELSRKQTAKMKSAILGESNAKEPFLSNVCEHIKIRRLGPNGLEKVKRVGDKSKSLPQMWGQSQKRSPAYVIPEFGKPSEVTLKSTPRDDVKTVKWIDYFAVDRQTHEFWRRYPEFVGNRLLGGDRIARPVTYPEFKMEDLQAGTLSVIQEGGAKARWVANPLLAFQALGEPLKDKLWAYTMATYSDVVCTDDQDRGYETVAQWLHEGRKVWCFDASSFTDRFPLALQLSVLQQLQDMGVASEADVESFKLVVQKPWKCNAIGEDVRWSVGQPLGYGPSFHLATLTHAALVDYLARNTLKENRRMFRIVGDDIVIADERLAQLYESAMRGLGVDINRQKSLISDEYAEFLGKIITKEGVNPSIKVKLLLSSDQIVDTVVFYGQNGLKWLTPSERERAMRVYLPVDLGGYGWRPPGQTYTEWLDTTQQDAFAVKRLLKDITSFYGRESLVGASDVEREITRRIEYYSINDYGLSASEWARLGVSEEVNALTGLPASKTREESRSQPSRSSEVNNFISIMDMVSKMSGPGLRPDLTKLDRQGTKDYLESILRDTHVAITPHGYLNNTEKPYTGQSVIEVTNERQTQKPAERVRRRDVFRKGKHQSDAEDPTP